VHPMSECARGSNNDVVSQLRELLYIEDHLGIKPSRWVKPSDLDILPVDVIFDNHIHLQLIQKKMSRGTQRILEWREAIH
jgi:hypothetical protein